MCIRSASVGTLSMARMTARRLWVSFGITLSGPHGKWYAPNMTLAATCFFLLYVTRAPTGGTMPLAANWLHERDVRDASLPREKTVARCTRDGRPVFSLGVTGVLKVVIGGRNATGVG